MPYKTKVLDEACLKKQQAEANVSLLHPFIFSEFTFLLGTFFTWLV